MKSKTKGRIGKFIIWTLNIVIIVLCIFLVFYLKGTKDEIDNALDYYKSTEYLGFTIEQEEYHELAKTYYYNTLGGYESTEEEEECYGVAKYYELAVVYKAYLETGNEEMVQKYREKMQEAESMMGEWIIAKEGIHKQLGID